VYEAAILKTLGANSRLIATMLLLEYGVLGAIAGTIGALGAIALSWAVARFALDLPWSPAPAVTVSGIVATSVLVAAIGVLASLDVLRHKPLATLRAE
jgi:putative ABC transport system permease protein